MNCIRRKLRAFSLIELLVVISIIALLIGILLPAMARMKEVVRKTACSSNLKQIGTVIQLYQESNEQKYPLARYMPDPFLTTFPGDPGLPDVLATDLEEQSKVYACPGDPDAVFPVTGISYTYNASLAGRQLDETWFARRLKFTSSEVPVAYDCDGNTFILVSGTMTVEPFHMLRNLLFADVHVGNYE